MASSLFRYIAAAFSARPTAMPLPPNWLFLVAAGLMGLVHPGFWLLGAGVELGYLWLLCSMPRFRRWVDDAAAAPREEQQTARRKALLDRLSRDDRALQELTEERCRQVIELHAQQAGSDDPAICGQAEALSGLAWVHLRLLATRASLRQLMRDAQRGDDLAQRVRELTTQCADPATSDDLRRSLTSQIEILNSRLAQQRTAQDQLTFVDAELERLRQQVELAREQALANAGSDTASRSIDVLGSTVREASAWVSEQTRITGMTDDIAGAPPLGRVMKLPHG